MLGYGKKTTIGAFPIRLANITLHVVFDAISAAGVPITDTSFGDLSISGRILPSILQSNVLALQLLVEALHGQYGDTAAKNHPRCFRPFQVNCSAQTS